MADRMVFNKTDTIGGGAGAVDNITAANRGDTNPLQTDDRCFVMKSGTFSVYRYDSTSSAAESDPDVIRPDDVAAIDPGRWILQGVTSTLADESVTNAKLAHIATSTIKGRVAAGTGDVEDLSAANVRTIINVADGANAYTHPNHTGDVTSTGDGATVIAAKVVAGSMLGGVSAVPSADTYEGHTITLEAHEDMVIGSLGFINASGEVALTDADAAATMPGCVIATAVVDESADPTGVFLLPGGVIHLHTLAPGWTIGGLVYAGSGAGAATAGALNQTAPAADSAIVQVVGVALAADILLFIPSLVTVEAHA
jgi:hypothetical protein